MIVASLALLAITAELPPSPASVPGTKIWPVPAFSIWPAVIHPGEARHAVLDLPIRIAGATTSFTWQGQTIPVTLPVADGWTAGQEPPGTPTAGALLELPSAAGQHTATTPLGDAHLRLVEATAPWPHLQLDHGHAVDAAGTPVVLLDAAHDAAAARRFAALATGRPRPDGPAVVFGDDLHGALTDLPDTTVLTLTDHRGACHPAVVLAAGILARTPAPRTLCWSPGTVALTQAGDEDRIMSAIATRCRALGMAPKLLLLLPECPVDRPDEPRRQQLAHAAAARGWNVVTVDGLAGKEAHRLGDTAWAAGPVGAARERLRTALVEHLR